MSLKLLILHLGNSRVGKEEQEGAPGVALGCSTRGHRMLKSSSSLSIKEVLISRLDLESGSGSGAQV